MHRNGYGSTSRLCGGGLLLFYLINFQGCSKDPAPIGSDLFKPPLFDSLTVYADSSSNYRLRISGNSSSLLIGAVSEIHAWSLLQFAVPAVDTSAMVSASLRLTPKYWLKDSSGTLAFTVHKILKQWSEFDVTFDSLNGLYDANSIGGLSEQISPSDTNGVTVQIDTAIVREWIRNSGEAYGILLKPDTTTSSVVYGFIVFDPSSNANLRPELIVRYNRTDTTGVIDSVVNRTFQETFVANSPLPDSADRQFVYLQAGVADRGVLYFNVQDSVPRSANIVSAELIFVRDSVRSIRNEVSQDSIVVHHIFDNTDSPRLGAATTAQPVEGESDSIFKADVRVAVQQWVTGKPNYGVALRAFGEFTTVDRFVVHGAAADSIHRPKLKILYSIIR
jgi:hypothetical protein